MHADACIVYNIQHGWTCSCVSGAVVYCTAKYYEIASYALLQRSRHNITFAIENVYIYFTTIYNKIYKTTTI